LLSIWASAFEKSRMIGRNRRTIWRAAAVGTMPCLARSNSFWPMCSSSRPICMLRAGWTMFRRRAARVTVPSSYNEMK
jgi:hypothetical protein